MMALRWVKRQAANILLAIVAVLCAATLVQGYLQPPALALMAPPEPAMVFHALSIDNPVVRAPEPIVLRYTYDKRPDCPYGYYKFHALFRSASNHFLTMTDSIKATEPAGKNREATMRIATDDLAARPGAYALELIAIFQCRGEADPQLILPSMQVPFDVVK